MKVEIERTELDDVLLVVPDRFRDERGFFTEVYRKDVFGELGLPTDFVQLNHSASTRNVVRGLHFQWDPPMGKLMRVTRGEAFLVAVDVRGDSSTLGRSVAVTLSEDDNRELWAPAYFARGFCVTSDTAEIEYLCTGIYNQSGEGGIRWNDPEIGIEWPVSDPVVSSKDATAPTLAEWLRGPNGRRFTINGPS